MQVRASELIPAPIINGNAIVHALGVSQQMLLRHSLVSCLKESSQWVVRIDCSRMEAERVYRAIAPLMLDLRRLLPELETYIELVEIFNTDTQSRFVRFSLFDDRMIG